MKYLLILMLLSGSVSYAEDVTDLIEMWKKYTVDKTITQLQRKEIYKSLDGKTLKLNATVTNVYEKKGKKVMEAFVYEDPNKDSRIKIRLSVSGQGDIYNKLKIGSKIEGSFLVQKIVLGRYVGIVVRASGEIKYSETGGTLVKKRGFRKIKKSWLVEDNLKKKILKYMSKHIRTVKNQKFGMFVAESVYMKRKNSYTGKGNFVKKDQRRVCGWVLVIKDGKYKVTRLKWGEISESDMN